MSSGKWLGMKVLAQRLLLQPRLRHGRRLRHPPGIRSHWMRWARSCHLTAIQASVSTQLLNGIRVQLLRTNYILVYIGNLATLNIVTSSQIYPRDVGHSMHVRVRSPISSISSRNVWPVSIFHTYKSRPYLFLMPMYVTTLAANIMVAQLDV